jgi:hypothetical protein
MDLYKDFLNYRIVKSNHNYHFFHLKFFQFYLNYYLKIKFLKYKNLIHFI